MPLIDPGPFKNRSKRPDETKACVGFGRWPLGRTLQSKFSLFCNQKFPPISHTSSLSAKF